MVDSDSRVRPGGSAATAGPPVLPQEFSRVLLIAVTIAVLVELLRTAFPEFAHLSVTSGVSAATVAALAFAAGFLAPVVRALAGPRGLLAAGVGGLLLARLLTQALADMAGPWPAVVGVAFGMLAVPALYETARGLSGTGFAVAVVGGLTASTALRLAFGTWDPAARTGVLPWLACLLVVALAAATLIRQLRAPSIEAPRIGWRDALGAAALGPFLTLQILVLASPAFAASSGGLPLAAAGVVVIAGQALSLAFLSSGLAVASVPGGVCVFGGTILGVGAGAVTGRYGLTGVVVPIMIVAGQVLSAWLLAVALRVPLRRGGYAGSGDTGGRPWRIDLGAALAGPLIVGTLLLYQHHYESPLPLPNKVLPAAAGILLGLLASIAAARGGPLPARSGRRALGAGASTLVLVAVPAAYALTAPPVPRSAALPGTFRVATYSIDDAVGRAGRLDLEAIAGLMENERADVVALQQVGRGWPRSGTTDVASWLARRLKMHMVWGAAADHQSGNAVLSRLPIKATGSGRLPVGAGPQARGYVWARVDPGGGRTADVWSVQLQQGADRGQTRLAEIGKLLGVWSAAPRTVIAGDLGAAPGSPELARLTTGQGGLRTAPAATPEPRAWILGTDDLGFGETSGPTGPASARPATAATVRVIG